MNEHISIDIEACGEVILSVGACKFDPETEVVGETFYAVLGVQEQLKRGLRLDAGAFNWWLQQSEAARTAITGPKEPVKEGLARLEKFTQPHGSKVWAYPASYDLPIIARLCETYGVRTPWKWTETMCARTLWQLAMQVQPGIERIETENPTPHHALEDAKEQARWIRQYLKAVVATPTDLTRLERLARAGQKIVNGLYSVDSFLSNVSHIFDHSGAMNATQLDRLAQFRIARKAITDALTAWHAAGEDGPDA